MLESTLFDIESVETSSLLEMESDLHRRLATGERWEFAIVEASEILVAGASDAAPHGMVLLRRGPREGTYVGVHYNLADCGVHSGPARVTAQMLCLLLGYQQVEQFYEGFVRHYPKLMAWDLGTENPKFAPGDN